MLHASDDVSRQRAWAAFLDEYSPLLLKVARRAASNHDGAMDRYAFMLDQLCDDGFHRLRGFAANGRGQFTTWLVVVARRLCVDHHRRTHGRPQGESAATTGPSLDQVTRHNLIDLVGSEIDWEHLGDGRRPGQDTELVLHERRAALHDVVEELGVEDRLLLTLRYEDEVPLAKIGPMIGLDSRWQVHRRLKVVLARLRAGLAARGITSSD